MEKIPVWEQQIYQEMHREGWVENKLVQNFAFKLAISMLHSYFVVCSFLYWALSRVWFFALVVENLCSLCMGLTSCMCVHGCILWLETAWFSLPMFFELKYAHESPDIQQLCESLLWKALPSFLPDLPPPSPNKWRIMASGYKGLESVIYYMDMQKHLIAFNERHGLSELRRWQIQSKVQLMKIQTIPFHIIRIWFDWLKTQ